MFKKSHRLTRNECSLIFERGRTFHGNILFLKKSLLPEIKGPKFAVVVSKKVAKSAVMRHLIKRRTYRALQAYSERIPPSTGIMVFLKPGQVSYGYALIEQELKKILSS